MRKIGVSKQVAMKAFVLTVSGISDGDAWTDHHGIFLSKEGAEAVEQGLRQYYAENYYPSFWDRQELHSSITEVNIYA